MFGCFNNYHNNINDKELDLKQLHFYLKNKILPFKHIY